jgi:hypothetical protein
MNKTIGALTVYFESPFWVGVFERIDDGKLSVCKVTFGAEPRDCEVWEFILRNYDKLKFSPAIETDVKIIADNPKRRQRNIKKQLQNVRIGTKSQQALAAQREKSKIEHKKASREQRKLEQQRKFDLRQNKRKEKHRGH